MITRIIAFLGFISTIATIAFLKGKSSNKQEIIQDELKDIKETEKRRDDRAKLSPNDKRRELRERRNRNKSQ